jgi:hypothetical protein
MLILAAPTKNVPRWVMQAAVTIGDLLAVLSGGCIKPVIRRQEFVPMAFEVTLDSSKARAAGYHPMITIE